MILLSLVRNDLKLFLKDGKALLLLLGMPFFFIFLFHSVFSGYLNKNNFIEPFEIAIVDKEASMASNMAIQQFEDSDSTRGLVTVIRSEEEEAYRLLEEGKAAAIVIIPEEFTYHVSIGENKPFTVIGHKGKPLQSYLVRSAMEAAANLVSAAQAGVMTAYRYYEKAGLGNEFYEGKYNETVMRFSLKAMARNEIFAARKVSSIPEVTSFEYFTAALLAVFMLFSALPVAKSMVNERSLGIMERLSASPVKGWHIILSKFITAYAISILQFSAAVFLTAVFYKVYWEGSLYGLAALFVSTMFAATAWAIFVAAVSPTPAAADMLANLSVILMAVAGGSIYPLHSMPEGVRFMSHFTINKWAMHGFLVLFSGERSLSVSQDVTVLLCMGMVLLLLSITALRLARR